MTRFAFLIALSIALSPAPAASLEPGDVGAEIRRLIELPDASLARSGVLDQLARFYRGRDYAPAWMQDGGWGERARAAAAALAASADEGLDPGRYSVPDLAAPAAGALEAARGDALLSAALLRYIRDVRSGTVEPSAVDREMAVTPERPDAAALLAEGLAAADFAAWLAALPPSDPAYARPRAELARYARLAAIPDWPRLPETATLRRGASGAAVADLRRLLALLGDLPTEGAAANDFDQDLEAAVRRFQRRHGLAEDGVVGRQTRIALNVSPAERLLQIKVNLERLRWFADPRPARRVVINAAAFDLAAIEGGRTILHSRVIVGQPRRRTPVFEDRIVGLTFRPSWTVPPRIARLDILPRAQEDPGYFAKHRMKVFSEDGCEVDPSRIDWKSIKPEEFRYKFRQEPGPQNALGGVRFDLTNEFDIFLHDTPKRALFERPTRTFSSGCIRVEEAAGLAAFVLQGNVNWPRERIEAAMRGSETEIVRLENPIPVVVNYLTAFVDETGTLQFRADVYGRDGKLARAMGIAP